MKCLGINWGHPSGAALLDGNTISKAVSEERFSRKKNDARFPGKAIDSVLGGSGENSASQPLDAAGLVSLNPSYTALLLQSYNYTIHDMVQEQHDFWFPLLFENKPLKQAEVFAHKQVRDQYPTAYWSDYSPEKEKSFAEDSRQIVADYLGMDLNRVVRVEHHQCHALYAYYGSPFRNERALVITIDGSGDGLNATASIADNGKLERFFSTDKCVIGRIYSHVTLLMGMKRLEHEYKVMGLAPYGYKGDATAVYEIFNNIIDVQGIEFVWKNKPRDSYFHFRDALEGYRFDIIAAGMQHWVEDILSRWVANLVRETGIKTIVLSGGVSMNVKAMGVLSRLPEVERMFIPGSGADETTCIGAAIGARLALQDGRLDSPVSIQSMYLGPDVDLEGVEEVRKLAQAESSLLLLPDSGDAAVAKLLASGLVIGRCHGAMEFGQRSLGNRAILADPTVPDLVAKINEMIKHRDFWMPFAPVLLDRFADEYLENPKGIDAPHMTLAFPTTEKGFAAMRAACHPADRTARAQILKKPDNPDLYRLLEHFEQLTGRGSLLNTSFNLHGSPIVNTALEAWDVFMRTGLECLWLPGLLIGKKTALEQHGVTCGKN